MSKKYFALFGFGIILFLSGQALAQTLKLPYRDVGACPFECCTYRQWTAKKNLVLYKQMSSRSPVAFRIKRGEKVIGMTGVVITGTPGKAEAAKDFTFQSSGVKLKKGETILLLTYMGEGWYRFWHRGKFYEDDGYEPGLEIKSQPKAVWWVKIKNRKGRIGWTSASEYFDNQDQCG